jgi:hypothetical protein
MCELCRLIRCALIGFFRSLASLEAEILVLRHQLNVLRRKSPKRPTFGNIDRLIFAGVLQPFVPEVICIGAVHLTRRTKTNPKHETHLGSELVASLGFYR